MSTLGLFQPGHSLVHRTPAGVKIVLLAVGIVAMSILVREPWQLLPAAATVLLVIATARLRLSLVLRQVRPLLWMLVIIGVFQVFLTSWQRAVVICGVLLLSVVAATLITLTTQVTEMLDVTTRMLGPLRRFGVDPDRVGLVFAMTIRSIPMLGDLVGTVTQARKARGLGFSVRALVVPVIVGALRRADALGDALIARGLDDPELPED
ncbi:energy-coupling factor transporter transmembrane component T family protein [Tomitella biformata]|uniref:energy-coupling factor transporter transmembrane component T family protein n=1 Tax=Tomitella biformata TaxID=630403 RepID=UPI000466A603|nr:energy-coupling factor transporter transmembrane protein EcfT [Tomitella biformata]